MEFIRQLRFILSGCTFSVSGGGHLYAVSDCVYQYELPSIRVLKIVRLPINVEIKAVVFVGSLVLAEKDRLVILRRNDFSIIKVIPSRNDGNSSGPFSPLQKYVLETSVQEDITDARHDKRPGQDEGGSAEIKDVINVSGKVGILLDNGDLVILNGEKNALESVVPAAEILQGPNAHTEVDPSGVHVARLHGCGDLILLYHGETFSLFNIVKNKIERKFERSGAKGAISLNVEGSAAILKGKSAVIEDMRTGEELLRMKMNRVLSMDVRNAFLLCCDGESCYVYDLSIERCVMCIKESSYCAFVNDPSRETGCDPLRWSSLTRTITDDDSHMYFVTVGRSINYYSIRGRVIRLVNSRIIQFSPRELLRLERKKLMLLGRDECIIFNMYNDNVEIRKNARKMGARSSFEARILDGEVCLLNRKDGRIVRTRHVAEIVASLRSGGAPRVLSVFSRHVIISMDSFVAILDTKLTPLKFVPVGCVSRVKICGDFIVLYNGRIVILDQEYNVIRLYEGDGRASQFCGSWVEYLSSSRANTDLDVLDWDISSDNEYLFLGVNSVNDPSSTLVAVEIRRSVIRAKVPLPYRIKSVVISKGNDFTFLLLADGRVLQFYNEELYECRDGGKVDDASFPASVMDDPAGRPEMEDIYMDLIAFMDNKNRLKHILY